MKKLKWAIPVLVLALLVLIPLNIGGLEERAYHRLVEDICTGMQQQQESFGVTYTGVYLKKDDLNRAVNEAISTSTENLFHVGGYSYVQDGAGIRLEINYSDLNDYPIYFAPTESEMERILQWCMTERVEGVNLFTYQPGAGVDDLKSMTERCYRLAYRSSGDDYNKYVIKKMDYGVTMVSSAKDTCFLTYSFVYNETTDQTEQVEQYARQTVQELGLKQKGARAAAMLINNTVGDLLSYRDTGLDSDYTAYGALQNSTAVCQGYALLTDSLLKEAGLQSRIITGVAYDPYTGREGAHMWNAVKVDGQWLHMDVTWNDAYLGKDPYFLLTDAAIARDHSFDTEQYEPEALDAGVQFAENRGNTTLRMKVGSSVIQKGAVALSFQNGRMPVLQDGVTMVPVEDVVSVLGGTVTRADDTGKYTVLWGSYLLELWPAEGQAVINGNPMRMTGARSESGMVSLRFLTLMLGLDVQWNEADQTIIVMTK